MPEAGIWRDQKLVICADAIYKFWLFQVHSRHIQFLEFVDFVRKCNALKNASFLEMMTMNLTIFEVYVKLVHKQKSPLNTI